MEFKNILIVDPFGSHTYYCEEIKNMGYKPFALITARNIPDDLMINFDEKDYEKVFYSDSFESMMPMLSGYNFHAVIPGDQLALRFVDKLAHSLGVPGNPVKSYKARVNKADMRQRLKEKNIDDVDFILSDDIDVVKEWARRVGFPVILKPAESAGGSLAVKKCMIKEDIDVAFEEIAFMGGYDGNLDGTVLAEEYLDGQEYMVNVMHDGMGGKKLVAIAGVEKLQTGGNASIYKNVYSLPLDSPEVVEAYDYITEINEALGIKIGINDTEVKVTSKGVRLVEVNNRLPGGKMPYVINRCSGFNCFQENIRLFCGEGSQHKEIHFKRHYYICCLINETEGVVKDIEGGNIIEKLESYDRQYLNVGINQNAPVTVDFITAWGLVMLVHEDHSQLKADAEIVHDVYRLVFASEFQEKDNLVSVD